VLAVTGRQPSPREPRPGAATHAGYVASAVVWMLLGAIAGVLHAWSIGGEPASGELSARVFLWSPALRDFQLHGVFLLMILGVSTRLLPAFLSLPPVTSDRPLRWLPWLNLGVALEAAGDLWVARAPGAAPAWALREVGVLLLAAGSLSLILPIGIYSARASASGPRPFVRAALAWLAVAFALLAAPPVFLVTLGRGPTHEFQDAARHAFTIGFAMMTVFGVSSMVGPALAVKPRLPRGWLKWSWRLLNAAVMLRVGGEVISEFSPAGYGVAGISGVVALAAFVVWAVPLWRCIADVKQFPERGSTLPVSS